MDELSNQQQAVELLQGLGLKEYEAKSFVALSRLPNGTAKEVSEISDVPRTRVYDAIRVLETKGLVEIQHSNPRVFRAFSIDEAAEILRDEYESRTLRLEETLEGIEPAPTDGDESVTHEVWALSGASAIANRTVQLIGEAEDELVLVIAHVSAITDSLLDALQSAYQRGVNVVIGTVDEATGQTLRNSLPQLDVFRSELDWLQSSPLPGDETEISRLLMVDKSTILVSTYHEHGPDEQGNGDEQAIFGRGFDNGLVTIVRRLMATGLPRIDDPATD